VVVVVVVVVDELSPVVLNNASSCSNCATALIVRASSQDNLSTSPLLYLFSTCLILPNSPLSATGTLPGVQQGNPGSPLLPIHNLSVCVPVFNLPFLENSLKVVPASGLLGSPSLSSIIVTAIWEVTSRSLRFTGKVRAAESQEQPSGLASA